MTLNQKLSQEDSYPLSSSLPLSDGILAKKVRKNPVMHGRPNSLLKAAQPIGPVVINYESQGIGGDITLKHDVETAGNMTGF